MLWGWRGYHKQKDIKLWLKRDCRTMRSLGELNRTSEKRGKKRKMDVEGYPGPQDTGPHEPYLDLPHGIGKSLKDFNSMCNMLIIISR